MRKAVLLLWLMIPILIAAYHYGPGQDRMTLDDVAGILARADGHASAEEWTEAIELYEEALSLLADENRDAIRRVRIERAKAWMMDKKLPDAHRDLLELVDELQNDADADSDQLVDARAALASAQYYMTWLMRLEGTSRERWEPEIESSRQIYRLLAESARDDGDTKAAKRFEEDLESAIRLARMDLGELQGLPLPSQ